MEKLNCIKTKYFVIAGLLVVCGGFLPCLLLGKGGVYIAHDQLDGEIFSYIFHARHLFDNSRVYPELMNGIGKEGLQMAAPLMVLLFCLLPPMQALFTAGVLIAAVGFCGMFACINRITGNKVIAFVVGGIFAYTPFYTVYGLSVMGIPMLLYAFYGLYRREHRGRNMGLTAFYGAMSSPVLVGFACLGILSAAFVVLLLQKKGGRRREMLWFAAGFFLLSGIYLVCNLSLFVQVLGGGVAGFVSHKEEIVVNAVPVQDTVRELLTDGAMHARGMQKFMLVPIGLAVLCGAVLYKKLTDKEKRVWQVLTGGVCLIFLLILFSAMYKAEWAAEIRNRVGGMIKYTQFDRVYWLLPAFWYIVFGAALFLLWALIARRNRVAAVLAAGCFVLITGGYVLWNSSFKANMRQLIKPANSNAVTWERFYNEEVYAAIDAYIGRDKETYRCLSLGVDPAAALYNGFFCLDGYSNNYDVNYKHQFRKIMEDELAKSEYLRGYFDNWGNRCYLFAAQLAGNHYIGKNSGLVLEDFSMDVNQAKEMGCEYLFSGLEILNAEKIGLEFLDCFETENSYYKIWLYRLK